MLCGFSCFARSVICGNKSETLKLFLFFIIALKNDENLNCERCFLFISTEEIVFVYFIKP